MKKVKILNNNSGFTLIEIIIAVGLLGALSAWMMDIFKQQTKNEKTTATNMDIDSTGQEIRNIVADGLSCEKTLKGKNPNTQGVITDIQKVLADGTAQSRFKVNEKKIGNSSVMISSFDLKTDETYLIPSGQKIGETVLLVNYDRGQMVSGSKLKTFKIPLTVSLDGAGNILTCHALASTTNLEALCNAVGRSVNSVKKKCDPPEYIKGDTPIFVSNYENCRGGAGAGEKVLETWKALSNGTVRLAWSGIATDNKVNWRVYKNSALISNTNGGGGSKEGYFPEIMSADIDVKKGDVLKHTVSMSGGYNDDCISGGSFNIGMDLLNML
ncbi:MAG: type II secretion system protein [Bacteriovorax sp.]|jgi:prepilin-type N-terminal cleavage/methylation domain-containing protein